MEVDVTQISRFSISYHALHKSCHEPVHITFHTSYSCLQLGNWSSPSVREMLRSNSSHSELDDLSSPSSSPCSVGGSALLLLSPYSMSAGSPYSLLRSRSFTFSTLDNTLSWNEGNQLVADPNMSASWKGLFGDEGDSLSLPCVHTNFSAHKACTRPSGGGKLTRRSLPTATLEKTNRGRPKHEDVDDKIAQVKRAFKKFKELKGHLEIPNCFKVPANDPAWSGIEPGWKLGLLLKNIRAGHIYAQQKKDWIKLGVDFNVIPKGDWPRVRDALLRYKELKGKLRMARKFEVPSSIDWPETMWEMKLGYTLKNIKYEGYYSDHRKELENMGVKITSKK